MKCLLNSCVWGRNVSYTGALFDQGFDLKRFIHRRLVYVRALLLFVRLRSAWY